MRDKRANYGVCKANFVLAQKETKNVSHMSPKSGQSVLKPNETKGTYTTKKIDITDGRDPSIPTYIHR